MLYSLVILANGKLKCCPSSVIEPTENTDTCVELDNENWKFGETTIARTAKGNRIAVKPMMFSGE